SLGLPEKHLGDGLFDFVRRLMACQIDIIFWWIFQDLEGSATASRVTACLGVIQEIRSKPSKLDAQANFAQLLCFAGPTVDRYQHLALRRRCG
uniref:hypothetical protein n=1 Tax=Pseudomonas viridiflava TaxID=33069 RepID=UPI0019CF8D9F